MELWKEFLVFTTDNKSKIAFLSIEDVSKSWLFDIPWDFHVNNKRPKMFLDKFEDDDEDKQKTQDSGKQELKELSIINIAIHEPSNLLAFTSTDKTLFLCKIRDSKLEVLSRRTFQRTSSVIRFSSCGKFLFLSDKTGDTFEYSCEDSEIQGRWIFGHISQILDLSVRSDLKFIITSDRDEKVRITNYPETQNIESFCLGHTAFVSSINFINNEKLLMTSSGDKTLRLWEYETGKEVQKIALDFVPITVITGGKYLTITSQENTVHVFDFQMNENSKVKITEIGSKTYAGNVNVCQRNDKFYIEYLESKSLLIDRIAISSDNSVVTFEMLRNATDIFNLAVHESFSLFKHFDVSILFKKVFDNIKPYIDRKKARIENAMAKKMKLDE